MKMDYTDDINTVSNNQGKLSNFRKYKWKSKFEHVFLDRVKSLFDNNGQALLNTIDENINTALDKITSLYHEAGEAMSQSPEVVERRATKMVGRTM